VDDPSSLAEILRALVDTSRELPVIFPIHPRTRQRLSQLAFQPGANFQLWEPQSYLQFLALQQRAAMVITDSGGIQEETTFLGVPCLTLRESTERPVTVTLGTNILLGRDLERLRHEISAILRGRQKPGNIPPLWDGKAAERIADVICGVGDRETAQGLK
jgi:UDP-N-acetylglucosamine 2-epimerase (non-hydrolysing)